jgi:hypothetical protein
VAPLENGFMVKTTSLLFANTLTSMLVETFPRVAAYEGGNACASPVTPGRQTHVVHKHTVASKFTPMRVTNAEDRMGEIDGSIKVMDKYKTLLTPEAEHFVHCTN